MATTCAEQRGDVGTFGNRTRREASDICIHLSDGVPSHLLSEIRIQTSDIVDVGFASELYSMRKARPRKHLPASCLLLWSLRCADQPGSNSVPNTQPFADSCFYWRLFAPSLPVYANYHQTFRSQDTTLERDTVLSSREYWSWKRDMLRTGAVSCRSASPVYSKSS